MEISFDNSLHLCLDMQRLFAPGAPWATPWMPRVLPHVVHLCEAFAPRNLFTCFIPPLTKEDVPGRWQEFYDKWHAVTRSELGESYLQLLPELDRFTRPGNVIDKTTYSAFADGTLHPLRRSKKIDTLVVSGTETDVCVLSSVLAAVDLGYRVILATDALCSSSDAGHDALMTMYQRRLSLQIELAQTAEITEWFPRRAV